MFTKQPIKNGLNSKFIKTKDVNKERIKRRFEQTFLKNQQKQCVRCVNHQISLYGRRMFPKNVV